MEADTHIDFLLDIDIEGLHFQPHRPEGIEFIPPGDEGLRLVLKPTNPDEDSCGNQNGLTCKVYKSYPATKEQVSFAKSHNAVPKILTRLADGISLPYKFKTDILIDVDGVCAKGFRPYRHICPTDIIELIELAESDMFASASRFLKLLRWRQDCDAQSEVIKRHSLYWRVGHGDYPVAPPIDGYLTPTTVQAMFGIHWSENHAAELGKLWIESDIIEPLGHTLLREAATLFQDSPRSSILIMVTALETAIKTHISRIVPDTSWLMEEISSPPIFKILRDYIPLINRNCGRELDFWEKLQPSIKKVQKLVELRNKIAHTGKIPIDANSIGDNIELVSDFLYILDVLDGHEWAKSLVNTKLRKTLEWPAPKEQRINITISRL